MNNHFNHNPQFNLNMLTEESRQEKKSLFADCSRLGIALLFYYILSYLLSYGFYFVCYAILSGSFTFSYNEVVEYLTGNHLELISSTVFRMGANALITAISLLLMIILCRFVLKLSFNGYLCPTKNGFKQAVVWSPACFVVNMIFSLAIAYVTSFLSTRGVYVPTSDFSLSSPSAASVIMQFAYVVVLAPIIEEFIYRGMILGVLSKYGSTAAVLLSALSFALMHGNIPQAASAFATGVVYAVIALQCGSIFPTVIIHAINNLIVNFTEFADALSIPNYDLIASIFEIAFALFGFFILFTRYSFLRYGEGGGQLDKKACLKTVFSNPVIIVYLLILLYQIFSELFEVNV